MPSSTSSSRFLKSLASHTLAAFPLPPSPPTLIPSGFSPEFPKGDVPPVPICLLPPSCLSSCSSSFFLNASRIQECNNSKNLEFSSRIQEYGSANEAPAPNTSPNGERTFAAASCRQTTGKEQESGRLRRVAVVHVVQG